MVDWLGLRASNATSWPCLEVSMTRGREIVFGSDSHDARLDEAIDVVHQIPKSATWIRHSANRISSNLADREAVLRDLARIHRLAEGMAAAAMKFLQATVDGDSSELANTTLAQHSSDQTSHDLRSFFDVK